MHELETDSACRKTWQGNLTAGKSTLVVESTYKSATETSHSSDRMSGTMQTPLCRNSNYGRGTSMREKELIRRLVRVDR